MARKKRLLEELERQRVLAEERLLFAGRCVEFAEIVENAQELTRFPLVIDTSDVLANVLANGSQQVLHILS